MPHPGLLLAFGQAARSQHPLPSLLWRDEQAESGNQPSDRQQIARLAHASAVTSLVFAEAGGGGGGPLLISADDDGRLKVWALRLTPPAALVPLASHRLHVGALTCMELHAPTGLLATGGDDGAARLWHLPTLVSAAAGQHAAAQRGCLAGHGGAIASLALSSCGAFLASCGADATLRLWHAAAREQLAALRLEASSLAFAPGDDAALLVAASGALQGAPQGPLLLDLRCVPGAWRYCARLAAHQQVQPGCGADSSPGGKAAPAAPAAHPMAAVWLGSPQQARPQAAVRARPPAGTAAVPPLAAAVAPAAQQHHASSSDSRPQWISPPRQAGSVVAFSRKRRRQPGTAAAAAAAAPPAVCDSACDWLPDGDPVLRPPAPSSMGGGLFGGWLAPPSPAASPAAALAAAGGPDCDGTVPQAAVAACFQAPPAAGSSQWDPQARCYAYRQGGHAAPVSWLLPLPCGLHVLTAACDGEAKLWVAAAADGSVAGTLLPAATEREESTLRCRPALASDGSWVVCGSPSGTLACWDLQAVQRSAHLPPGGAAVNAAAACRPHGAAVTAVAVGLGDTLLCSGDATGRLLVRWR